MSQRLTGWITALLVGYEKWLEAQKTELQAKEAIWELEENKIELLHPKYVVGVSSKITWWRNTKTHGREKQ